MKKILVAAAFLIGSAVSAFATCAGTSANLHDFAGTSFLMSLANNAGDGNCSSNVTVIGAPAITGTVTANAGTNLNTSTLALEGGGNLAALNTILGTVTASPTANTIADRLKSINTTLGSPFQAGGAVGLSGTLPAFAAIPTFKIDQTTLGTTNGVQDASTSATGSAVPSKAGYFGAISSGNLTGVIQADKSAPINISTATTTQIVALSSGKLIYVTGFNVIAGGAGNFSLVYGTGTNCGTGTTTLAGPYNLTAQSGLSFGGGLGPVFIVPASNALCVVDSAAVAMVGSLPYTQF